VVLSNANELQPPLPPYQSSFYNKNSTATINMEGVLEHPRITAVLVMNMLIRIIMTNHHHQQQQQDQHNELLLNNNDGNWNKRI
jgi:hypothetical protein